MTTATSRCCHLSTKSLTIIEIIMFRIFFSSSVSLNHTTHLSIISRSNDLSSLVENHLVKFLFSNWFVFCSNPRINSAQNSSLKLSHESFKEDKIFACVTIFVKIIRRGDSGISIIRTIIFDPYSIRKTRLDCSRREWCISRIGDFFFFSRRTLSKLKIYIELHFSLVSKHELYLNFDFLSNFLFRRRSLIFTLLLEINFHHSVSRIHTNDKSCLLINKKRKKGT